MIETFMLIGLGFVVATLIAFLVAPPVWRRAVRITTKQIQSRSPLTMAEIQAERDQMKAEFAQTTRRLEVTVAELKQKTVDQAVRTSRGSAELEVHGSKLAETNDALETAWDDLRKIKHRQEPMTTELSELRKVHTDQTQTLEEQNKRVEELSAQLTRNETARKEQARELERAEGKLQNLRKKRRRAPAKETKSGAPAIRNPVSNKLAQKADKLAVFAEEMPERLNQLKLRQEQLNKDKLTFDDQHNVNHEDAAQHNAAIEKYQSDRDELRQEITSAQTDITELRDEILTRDADWQRDNDNPFQTLDSAMEDAGQSLATADGTFNETLSLDGFDIEADIDDPVEQVDISAEEEISADPMIEVPGQPKSQPRSGSLADRIRALQDQIGR